jgi:hypothetical protein
MSTLSCGLMAGKMTARPAIRVVMLVNRQVVLNLDYSGRELKKSLKGTSKNSNLESNCNEFSLFQPLRIREIAINRSSLSSLIADPSGQDARTERAEREITVAQASPPA